MRSPGWEERLAVLVDAADRNPYRLGEHDCFRFACADVAALTGHDAWPRWAGRYSTRADCIRLIRGVSADLETAIAAVLGVERVPVLQAGRGDIYLYADRLPHLAVGLGPHVAVLLEDGLGLVRPDDPRIKAAWRVG